MVLKDISLPTPQENILYDDVLLNLAEQNHKEEILRFWESKEYFVVLGRISKEKDDIYLENTERDNISVFRRSSGGGTVVQGPGCLNYSLVLSKDSNKELGDIRQSYAFILDKVISALKLLDVQAKYFPISDIALIENEKKISGNAQKRSKRYLLHHGTILCSFDLKKVQQYLKMPLDVPKYRKQRGHLDFITNIQAAIEDVKVSISDIFSVQKVENQLSEAEAVLLARYLKEKKISLL